MDSTLLVVVAAACGAAAIWLWMQVGKLQDDVKQALARADKADAEAVKAADRAEQLRKKLERQGDENAREDRSAREARQRLADTKEELQKTRAALKRVEALAEEQAGKLRKAEVQIEELAAMAAVKRTPKPEPAPEPAPPPEPAVDPKLALRQAELDAERETRQLERQKLNAERDAARQDREREKLREFLDKLQVDRDRWRQSALDRELELRILRRKAEHNRRAWVMTMGALDLAEDELYRIKHGTERPEYTPNRAAHVAAAEEVVPSHEPESAAEPEAESHTEA